MRLLDELQRRIQAEGIQFSFLITAILLRDDVLFVNRQKGAGTRVLLGAL